MTNGADAGGPGVAQSLECWPVGPRARVLRVDVAAQHPEWHQQLADLGFTPGEAVSVHSRARWAGDRMVVRIGRSRFALRRAEAACVWVQPA